MYMGPKKAPLIIDARPQQVLVAGFDSLLGSTEDCRVGDLTWNPGTCKDYYMLVQHISPEEEDS